MRKTAYLLKHGQMSRDDEVFNTVRQIMLMMTRGGYDQPKIYRELVGNGIVPQDIFNEAWQEYLKTKGKEEQEKKKRYSMEHRKQGEITPYHIPKGITYKDVPTDVIDNVVDEIIEMYYEHSGEILVQAFPDIKTGDEDPGAYMELENAVRRNVESWLRNNFPTGNTAKVYAMKKRKALRVYADMKQYNAMAKKYGEIKFQGKKYALTGDAGMDNYGTEGDVAYYGSAIDKIGNEYRVRWETTQEWDDAEKAYGLWQELDTAQDQRRFRETDEEIEEQLEELGYADENGELRAESIIQDESNACDWDHPDSVDPI